jgi:hypothetical protein
MDSSSTSANSSFGSTASSSSPRAPTQEPSDHAESGDLAAAIKQEPSLQDAAGHPDNVWAHIFDENNPICLDVDDDDPMDEEDVAADPRRETAAIAHHQENGEGDSRSPIHVHDPTPSAALLDNWGYYDEDMLSPSQHHANGSAAMAHVPSLPPIPAFGKYVIILVASDRSPLWFWVVPDAAFRCVLGVARPRSRARSRFRLPHLASNPRRRHATSRTFASMASRPRRRICWRLKSKPMASHCVRPSCSFSFGSGD